MGRGAHDAYPRIPRDGWDPPCPIESSMGTSSGVESTESAVGKFKSKKNLSNFWPQMRSALVSYVYQRHLDS